MYLETLLRYLTAVLILARQKFYVAQRFLGAEYLENFHYSQKMGKNLR